MQYCLKLSSTAQNPAYSGVFAGKFKLAFDRKPNQIPPLGIQVQPDLHAVGFKQILCRVSSRLCLGAYRTSPSSSLSVLANEPPLYIRQKRLSMQCCLKLSSTAENPAYSGVFAGKFKLAFDCKPNQILPLGTRVQLDLHAIGFKQKDTVQSSISRTPPWLLDHPRVNFDLHCFHKEDTVSEIYRSRFHELCSHCDGFRRLYTDGSKIGDHVASAAVARNSTKTVRLPDKASIFRAELYAISLAMDFIRHSKDSRFIVFSDSKSSLEALNGFRIELNLVLKIIKDCTSLIKAGKVIEFCWISSHVNIKGNERADTAAKAALCLPVISMKLPASDFKPCASRFCLEEWQDIWNSAANNKLHAIYPTVGKCVHNNLVSRRDAVIVNRLKILPTLWRGPTNMYKV